VFVDERLTMVDTEMQVTGLEGRRRQQLMSNRVYSRPIRPRWR
jgi:hypothetical protein